MVIPGSDMIGTLILLMILRIQPQKELLRGTGVKHTAWMTSVPLEPCQPSNTRCSGSWLHTVNWIKSGNQKVPETCVVLWHHDRIFAVAISLSSEIESCCESCITQFPTKLSCSTRVDVLETGDVPILFSLPQMNNLGITIEFDPKGDKIHVQLLVCTLLQLKTLQRDILFWT